MGVVLDRQAGARIVSLGECGMGLQEVVVKSVSWENSVAILAIIHNRTSATIHWDETN